MSAEAATGPPADEPQPSHRRRRRLPLVLIAVATLLAFLAVFAVWANRQMLNTDNWTETSSELLENEDVREQISIFLVDELYANVDVEARIEEVLPPRGDPLAGAAAAGLKNFAEQAAAQLLARPRPQQLWEEANRRAHRRLLAVVEGGGDNVSTEDGNVTLDLKSLLGATQERVGAGGRVEEKLPAEAAQITILKSDELGLAQDLLDMFKAIVVVLVLLALGLYALAVYLARGWRREALRAVGIGFFIAGAGALVARSLAGDAVVSSLAGNESVEPAVQATWTSGTSLLQQAAGAMVAYGVAFFLGAWLAGPTGWAVAARRGLAPYLREPRYAYGALTLIALLLLAWGPTPAFRRLLPALLLIGLLTLGVEMLRRQTAREYPDANIEEATQRMRAWFSNLAARRRGGAAAPGAEDRLGELERLAKLRDAGVLDGAEFDREKARIMERAPAGAGAG